MPWSDSALPCGDADVGRIRHAFVRCADEGFIGPRQNIPGITCEQACCALGYPGCRFRAAQAGFDPCVPKNPIRSGACADVWADQWSSQCVCAATDASSP